MPRRFQLESVIGKPCKTAFDQVRIAAEVFLELRNVAAMERYHRHHPQLARFRALPDPLAAIATFLAGIADEAARPGYRVDLTRVRAERFNGRIPETRGQLQYEWDHLGRKLRLRSPQLCRALQQITSPRPHPLFRIVPGDVTSWERNGK